MNSHEREIYRSQLEHGIEWKKHKYLYKDGDRYIYPEDIKNMAKEKASAMIADQKQKHKDRKFVKSSRKNSLSLPAGSRESHQIKSAHQGYDRFGDSIRTPQEIRDEKAEMQRRERTGLEYSRQISDQKYNENRRYQDNKSEVERNLKERRNSRRAEASQREREAARRFDQSMRSGSSVEKQIAKKTARDTVARTDETIERMRKRRKRQRPYSHY